jgi:rubrerythrin
MRHDVETALAFYAMNNSDTAVAVDDETDLLAAEDVVVCPDCGTELVDFEDDPFALRCPVCDRRYR